MAICYIGGMKKDRYEWIKNNISQIGKKNWKLTEAIARNKKDAAIALVCVVLVIVAVVSIVKIVNLHSAEIKQEQEIQALQEEYTSESGDTASMQDESELVKKTDDDLKTEPEDDPNAWLLAGFTLRTRKVSVIRFCIPVMIIICGEII